MNAYWSKILKIELVKNPAMHQNYISIQNFLCQYNLQYILD